MRRNRKSRNRRKKSKGNGVILPVVTVCLLVFAAIFFSPKEVKKSYDELSENNIGLDSLVEGRHFTFFNLDSITTLVRAIDPKGTKCNIQDVDEKAYFTKGEDISKNDFRRIFLNLRPISDWRKMKNCPVEFMASDTFGFVAPVRLDGTEKMIPLPYDIVAGMMFAYGQHLNR